MPEAGGLTMKFTNRKTMILAAALLLPAMPASAGNMMQGLGGLMDTFGGSGKTAAPESSSAINALSNSDIVAGLKDALRVGSEHVVAQLGKTDGFNADPQVHIPLPDSMQKVKSTLDSMGMGSMMDDLELKMNRAAEAATPKAKKLFGDAIKSMSIDDAKNILQGPDNAATQYFKGKMSAPLAKEMQPIVDKALNQAGAVKAYDAVMGKYKALPFMPDVKANLDQYVTDQGLKGIFHYMAVEEAAIRKDPVKRTTEILQKVFGSLK
jgi:Protein of unknown function (DUF4197)